MRGKPIGAFLQPWQSDIIESALSPAGAPKKSIALAWSRKIGKSSLYSWILSYFLSEKPGWLSIIQASVWSQTEHIFRQCAQAIQLSHVKGDFRITRDLIENRQNGSRLLRVYSSAGSNLGYENLRCLVADQCESMDSKENYHALESGMMLSDLKPLILLASNAPAEDHWILDHMRSLRKDKKNWRVFEYYAPPGLQWDSLGAKCAANPLYRAVIERPKANKHLSQLKRNIDDYERRAKASSLEQQSYRRYILGQRLTDSETEWINAAAIKVMPLKEALARPYDCSLSVDLALSIDFACAQLAIYPKGTEQIILKTWLSIPGDMSWRSRQQRLEFQAWANDGHIQIQRERKSLDRDLFLNPIKAFLRRYRIRPKVILWDKGLASAAWQNEMAPFGKNELMRTGPLQMTGGVRLIQSVGRQGGLYITEDNPAVRRQFQDSRIAQKSKSYVNITRTSNRRSIEAGVTAAMNGSWRLANCPKKFLIMTASKVF